MASRDFAADACLNWLTERTPRWVEILELLVALESPSGDPARLRAVSDAVRGLAAELFAPEGLEIVETRGLPAVLARMTHGAGPATLILCHLDTVWEVGAFQPLYREVDGRASGPGVFDMKGGVVIALAALAALRALSPSKVRATLLCTCDEEVGSAGSRALIEAEARQADAVLVLEAPSGGAVKVARKGVGTYHLRMAGRAAHAGLEPERGVNAVVELAALIPQVAALARPDQGTTVTPTVFQGGGRVNVVPAAAELRVDVRFATAAEADRVDRAMRALVAENAQATLTVSGGPNRPPMERSASDDLFKVASRAAAELGFPTLEGTSVGGGSDGNFTAALGIPTLDGMGIVGGNAHAAGEWADTSSIAPRAALVAACVKSISEGALG